jgi:hypothetical protein
VTSGRPGQPPWIQAGGFRFEPEVFRATADARYVLCATDDGRDDGYRRLRAAATILAKRAGAKLLLVDSSAGPGAARPAPGGSVLGRAEVRRLGRPHLAEQIDEAAAAGVEAGAWLPGPGADLDEAVRRLPVDAIVAAREAGDPPPRPDAPAGRATLVGVGTDLTVRVVPGSIPPGWTWAAGRGR